VSKKMAKRSKNKKNERSKLDRECVSAAVNGGAKMGKKEYEKEIFKLQLELVKVQD